MEVPGREILIKAAHVNEVVWYTLPLRNRELYARGGREDISLFGGPMQAFQ